MASVSQSSGSSSSTPTIVSTPENAILNQLSGVAAGLAQQMLGWANSVYAQTSEITNQAVGNFFNVSNKMMGLSNSLTDQYNNIFAPQNASLAREADQYNSAARRQLNMGEAGATQAMAGEAALKNAEAALQSYGIDPSSGRYAALETAGRVQNAANVAGAMNQQRNKDVEIGQRLRSEAVQVGAQLPAAIANTANTALQANTGASNAILANANTGVNLMNLPNNFLKTAMSIPLSPIGNKTQSSQQSSSSSSPDRGGGGGGGSSGGGGGGFAPGGGGGGGWQRVPTSSAGGGGEGNVQLGKYNWGTNGVRHLQPYDSYDASAAYSWQDDPSFQPGGQYGGYDGFDFNSPDNYYQPQYDQFNDPYSMDVGAAGTNDPFSYSGGGWDSNPFEDSGFGQEWDYGGGYDTYTGGSGGTNTPWGNINYDTAGNNANTGWDNVYDQPQADTDWGSGADAYQSYGYQGADYGGNSASYGAVDGGSNTSWASYDPSGYTPTADSGTTYSDYDYYAEGGPVPESMSPSGGQAIDDVPAMSPAGPARLNANEFVIPEDVARWKGEEFFQNLIMQSRNKRLGAPAKPKMSKVA